MTDHPDNAPYLGLRPFTESEKGKFFGRDEEIHILTDKILAHRLTLLVAASGVGKSSLLQAGVMPALRASGMADLIYHNDWAVDPARDLKHSIVKHFIQQQRVTADYAPDLDQPLNEFLQTHALLGIGTVVILLDQFEEFFYYQKFSQQRDQFIQQLAAALHDSDTPTAFVFSMREDFAMEMEAFKPFFKGIFDNIYRIEKLELAAARLAILKPIEAFGYHYQPELLEQLLADLGRRERNERLDLQHADQAALTEARVEPPHLQIVCQQLWLHAHASASQAIGLDHYQQLGKAAGILSSYFNDKMAKLDRAQQRLASRAFDLLVSQHGAKMAYPLDELAKLLRENPDSLKISLDQLQTAAILRRIQRQGKPWYELYHDIFAKSITEWNQAYKKKQLREQLLKRGGAGVLTCLALFASYDGWENHQQRHFRLGQETVSERVEVYQGKFGSWDIFGQRKFLYESDFERQDIEADKRFENEGMAERDNSVEMQIGELPLSERFLNYAEAGLFDSGDRVFEAVRKAGEIVSGLASIHANSSVDRLLVFKDQKVVNFFRGLASLGGQATIRKLLDLLADNHKEVRSRAAEVLGMLKAEAAMPKLIALLADNDAEVRFGAAEVLGKLNAEVAIPKLIALLADDDGWVRSRAAEALGKLKAEAAIPELIALLADNNADVRSNAAEVLGTLKAEAAIPKLIALLADNDGWVRSSAASALGNLKAEAAIPKLIALLADNDVCSRAAEALGKLKAEAAIPKLIALLADNNVNVHRSAAWALVKLKAEAAMPKLIALLADNDADVRSYAAWALGNLKAEAAMPKLIALLTDSNANVRSRAAEVLGKLKAEAAIPKLITLLADNDANVRLNAAEALGTLKAEAAMPKLITLLADNDANVRSYAAAALGDLKIEAVMPKLIALLADNDQWVRSSAARALFNLKAKAAMPKLITLLADNNAEMRSSAAGALDALKAEAAIPKLIALLADSDADVRSSAAWSLGTLKAEAAMPKLITLLADNDANVRSSAAGALGKLNAEAAMPRLIALLADNNLYVRRDAAEALVKLKAEAAIPKLIALLADSDADVRSSAAWSLGTLKAEAAIPKLLALLADNDATVRSFAAQALGKLRATAAIPALLTLLDDNDSDVRAQAAKALGRAHAIQATPALVKRLSDDDPKVQHTAALALHQMRQQPAELLAWQPVAFAKLQAQLQQAGQDEAERQAVAGLLFGIHSPDAVKLFGQLLQDQNAEVLAETLSTGTTLGRYHAAWFQPYLPQIIQLTQHSDLRVQLAAVAALRNLMTFEHGQQSGEQGLEQSVLASLKKILQNPRTSIDLRLAVVDALGESERDEAAKTLLSVLTDPQQKPLHSHVAFWLAKLTYRPAQAELQTHFDTLVHDNQAWRKDRDAGKFVRKSDDSTDKKDDSWKDSHALSQYAYALARIAPEKDGVAMLSHPLYQVRQAAIQALAEKANGALLQQVLAAHQAFDARDLPSPFPTTAYRALDKMLTQLEFNGTKADLALLKTLKATNFPAQPKQQRALNERFDWTIAELEYRLGKK